jgi:hypothetical protein
MTPIEKLIKYYGNASIAAHELKSHAVVLYGDNAQKFDRQVVHNWRDRGFIPWKQAELIAYATKGKIRADEVREAAAKARKH